MPDREKVFDAFRNCIAEPKCKDCPWETCEEFHQAKTIPLDLCLDILKLLKDQEPLEPITDGNEHIHVFRCRKCNRILQRNNEMDYCPKCGQAVKWE